MIVREALQSDTEHIAQLQVDTWHSTYTGLIPQALLDQMSVSKRTEVWREIISKANSKIFLLEQDETLVGFVNVGPTRDKDKDSAKTGEISAIYIKQAYQGVGSGQKLFARAINFLHESGYSSCILWVLDTNTKAIRFYEKMGMKPDGVSRMDDWGCAKLRVLRYGTKVTSAHDV